jgi:RecA-family ATPase
MRENPPENCPLDAPYQESITEIQPPAEPQTNLGLKTIDFSIARNKIVDLQIQKLCESIKNHRSMSLDEPLSFGASEMKTDFWLDYPPQDIPEDHIIPGFLAGTVGALVAPGGTGKSYLALELAIAVACPNADLADFKPRMLGQVAYINAEDDLIQLGKRLAWLGQRIKPELRTSVAALFRVARARGSLIDLGQKPFGYELEKPNNDLETPLDRMVRDFKGYRLIIIDTLTRFHSLDENSNGQMSQLISNLEYLAEKTGAAVLFLHHTNKNAIRDSATDSQAASRGASALVDNVRFAAYLVKMTEIEAEDYGINPEQRGFFLRYGVAKQNYGIRSSDRWFERKEGGVLLPVELTKILKSQKGNNNGKNYRHDQF